MKPVKIETWQCGECGSRYSTKKNAEECCGKESYYCGNCGEKKEIYLAICSKCRWEKADVVDSFMVFPLFSDTLNEWFINASELKIALDDYVDDYSLEELLLFCSDEIRPEQFSIREYLVNCNLMDSEIDEFPDDFVPSKQLDKVDKDINEILEALPSSYNINWKKRPSISRLAHLYHPDSKHRKPANTKKKGNNAKI
jgi:hypothetical protein